MAYTYEDFKKALNNSGLGSSFSQYDLDLAKQNPNAGMGILSQKQNWAGATSQEAKNAANAAAEQIRKNYGSYTGGAWGNEYNPLGNQGSLSNKQNSLLEDMLNYDEYSYGGSAPSFSDPYRSSLEEQLQALVNRKDFSYNHESDPLYSQYRKQYLREGDRALRDTMASAAAMTGGIPSSYAMTAGQQAQDYWNAQLTDKIPALEQQAYNKYLNDYNMNLSTYDATRAANNDIFNYFESDRNQYNIDRDFDYQTYADAYDRIYNNLGMVNNMDNSAYNQYLSNQDLMAARDNAALNKALLAQEAGDSSYWNNYLTSIGINVPAKKPR